MKTKEIVRGCKVKNIITGVEGIAGNRSETLSGSVQFSLLREGTNQENENFKEIYFDIGFLERIGDGLIEKAGSSVETKIENGDQVKHLSGFTGIVTERVDFFNGCISFAVCPPAKDKKTPPETNYYPCQYLTVVKKKATAEKPKEKNPPGGPSSTAPTSARH